MRTSKSHSFGGFRNRDSELEQTLKMSAHHQKLKNCSRQQLLKNEVVKKIVSDQNNLYQETVDKFQKTKGHNHRASMDGLHKSTKSYRIMNQTSPKIGFSSRRTMSSTSASGFFGSTNSVHYSDKNKKSYLDFQDKNYKSQFCKTIGSFKTHEPLIPPAESIKKAKELDLQMEESENKKRDLDNLLDNRFQLKVEKTGVKNIRRAIFKMSTMKNDELMNLQYQGIVEGEKKIFKKQRESRVEKIRPLADFFRKVREMNQEKEDQNMSTARYFKKMEQERQQQEQD